MMSPCLFRACGVQRPSRPPPPSSRTAPSLLACSPCGPVTPVLPHLLSFPLLFLRLIRPSPLPYCKLTQGALPPRPSAATPATYQSPLHLGEFPVPKVLAVPSGGRPAKTGRQRPKRKCGRFGEQRPLVLSLRLNTPSPRPQWLMHCDVGCDSRIKP